MIGKTVSHYKILEKLGEGGMGVVYKAEDTKLGRSVALKFLPLNLQADEEEKQRFIHEAKTASALDHPNVCTIYEIDESEDGQIFIAMAYYEGELLKDKIDKGPLKLEEALNFATRIAEGLERTHEAEIIHRDIKPANIMVTDRGEVKILDFGLAKLAGQTKLTKAGTTLGTIAYMSPEQTKGEEVDHHSDLFSFGAVLYEMLTGQHPFKGDYEMAVMYAIMNENPEPLTAVRSGVPMSLEQVVNKALEKDKELRYQTASDLLADLKKVTKELESGEKVTTSKQVSELKKPGKFKRVWIPMVAVLVLLAGLVVLLPLFKEEPLVSDLKPIAVVPFENKTGDENLDYLKEVIPNLLITNLEQSRYLNLMTWERMQDLLRVSGKKDLQVADIDKDIGFELCRMDGIQAIVLGSFTKAGDLFATDIKVLDVETKILLLSTNAKGAGVGSILDSQIDELTKAISRRVIEPFAKFSGQNLIVKNVTTNSMEAYRFYRRGVWDYNKYFQASSITNLKRATQLDPSFAMAYYYLARVYFQLQNIAAGKSALREAEAQSDKTTEREQLYIEMDYAKLVEENVEKAIKLNEELVEKFPKEKEAFYFLAVKYRDIGKNAEAIQLCKQALTLDPNWGKVHNELGYRYVVQGEYEQAEKSLRKYAALTAEQPNAFDSLGELFFVMGRLDDAVLNFELAWEVSRSYWFGTLVQLGYIHTIRQNFDEALLQSDKFFTRNFIPEYKCIGYWNRARLYFHLGRYEDAIGLLNQQVSLADSAGIALREAQAHELMSFIHAERRNFTEAENELQTCLKLRLRTRPGTSRFWRLSYQCFSSLLDIRQGKLEKAREKFKATNEMLPQLNHRNKEMYVYWLSLLQGEIALAEGNPQSAIGKFNEVILPNPLFLTYSRVYLYRLPIAKDGLARAYETAGLLDDAIAEYQRLSTFDAGSKERFLINPKYHHRLAKLYEEKGQSELAIKELQKFLDIWKEADEDLPELIDAKARLARLKKMSIK